MPKSWPGFEIAFQYRSARYEIAVENPHGVSRGVSQVIVDGEALPPPCTQIALADDAATHHVRVILGDAAADPGAPNPGRRAARASSRP